MLRKLLVIVFCLNSAGCVMHNTYPDEWSPTVEGEGCPDISGTYFVEGQSSSAENLMGSEQAPPLGMFLDMQCALEEESIAMPLLTISQPNDDTLVATCSGEGRAPYTKTLSRADGDFRCDDGAIWIDLPLGGFAVEDMFTFFVDGGKVGFMRNEGGSLVGVRKCVGGGVMLGLIPLAGYTKEYFMWECSEEDMSAEVTQEQ